MARHRAGCDCPQCNHTGGGPDGRPLPWQGRAYDEMLDPAITIALGGALQRATAEAVQHPGPPGMYLAEYGPLITIQNYAAPAAQPKGV